MEITRYSDAKPYQAPLHYDMQAFRLQGFEASSAEFAWTGLSHFQPGGGVEMSSGPLEKIYIILKGELTIELEGGETHTLRRLDSCLIAAGEMRAVRNESDEVVTMLVVMPYANEVKVSAE
jgi:quercetin dioxygenase-like cupin family protein